MSLSNYEKYQHLDKNSIEQLDISSKALEALAFYGLTSVCDCINFFVMHMLREYHTGSYTRSMNDIVFTQEEHQYAKNAIRPDLFYYMIFEVKPKLQESGLWQFIEDAEEIILKNKTLLQRTLD